MFSLFAAVTVAFWVSGCYEQIVEAVVDDNHEPGGVMQVQIGDGAPGETTGLASGDPLIITGQNTSLVIALTVGDTATGASAKTALATPGAQITANFVPKGRNQLQVHIGGNNCVADSGSAQLTANTDGTISGTFSASGTVTQTGAAFTLTGKLTEVPFWK